MDGTRVERKRPVTPVLDVSRQRTRIKDPLGPLGGLGSEERLALFCHSIARDRAGKLLEGLSEEPRRKASQYLVVLGTLPSSERQGRLASEFGIRIDSSQRLREIWLAAGPELRREIFRLLPPYHRTLFPEYVLEERPAEVEVASALKPFAERLILEATR